MQLSYHKSWFLNECKNMLKNDFHYFQILGVILKWLKINFNIFEINHFKITLKHDFNNSKLILDFLFFVLFELSSSSLYILRIILYSLPLNESLLHPFVF